MLVLKALLPDDALQLSDAALGAYLKLKALASHMTVKGVFINGCCLTLEDMVQRAGLGDGWKACIDELQTAEYLKRVGGVWYFANSQALFQNTQYADSTMAKVLRVVQSSVKREDVAAVLHVVHEAGEFKKTFEADEMRDQLRRLFQNQTADRSQ